MNKLENDRRLKRQQYLMVLILVVSALGLLISSQAYAVPEPVGWGNAQQVCNQPEVGRNSNASGFPTDYYNIVVGSGYLSLTDNAQVEIKTFTNLPATSWLVSSVGRSLYQIATCQNDKAQCLSIDNNKNITVSTCGYEGYGSQVWWEKGIVQNSGETALILGNDGVGQMECLGLSPESGAIQLSPCKTDVSLEETLWRFKPVTEISAGEMVTYQCDSTQRVEVLYDTEQDQVLVNYDGSSLRLDPVQSGSGSKYGGNNKPWGWWTKGEQGFIFAYDNENVESEIIEQCIEISPQAEQQQQSDELNDMRKWSSYGTGNDILVSDCTDCGDDVGAQLVCQGESLPALASFLWLGSGSEEELISGPIEIRIGDQFFERTANTTFMGGIGNVPQVELEQDDALLQALATGSQATIMFRKATVEIGLDGSAAAIDSFKLNCSNDSSQIEENLLGSTDLSNANENGEMWFVSEYDSYETNEKVIALFFGIPETDAIAFHTECSPASISDTIQATALFDVSSLKHDSVVSLKISTMNFDQEYNGLVSDGQTGYSGINIALQQTAPLWSILSSVHPVIMTAKDGVSISMYAPNSSQAVNYFIKACSGQ